jgi:hypothetical protein
MVSWKDISYYVVSLERVSYVKLCNLLVFKFLSSPIALFHSISTECYNGAFYCMSQSMSAHLHSEINLLKCSKLCDVPCTNILCSPPEDVPKVEA